MKYTVTTLATITLLVVASFGFAGCTRTAKEKPRNARESRPESNPPVLPAEVDYKKEPLVYYAKTHAVIVGINDYTTNKNGVGGLTFPVDNARRLEEILRTEYGYQTCLLINEEATNRAIEEALAFGTKANRIGTDDAVLFFFSGHGEVNTDADRQTGYLACFDSNLRDLKTCLAVSSFVAKRMSKLPCRHKAIILDCCFSGSMFVRESHQEAASAPDASLHSADKVDFYLRNDAFWGLSAAQENQPVSKQSSVFFDALFTELREQADSSDEKHVFTFQELAVRVKGRAAKKISNRLQIPEFGRISGRGEFLFRPTVMRLTPTERVHREKYAAEMQQAQRLLNSGDIDGALNKIDLYVNQDEETVLPSLEWNLLFNACRPETACFDVGGIPISVDVSCSGELGCGLSDGRLRITRIADGRVIQEIAAHDSYVLDISFSPSGHRIATTDQKTIRVWDTKSGHQINSVSLTNGGRGIGFGPDDDSILFSDSGSVWQLQFQTSDRKRLSDLKTKIDRITVSLDGQLIGASDESGTVHVFDSSSSKKLFVVKCHDAALKSLVFSEDGSLLASADARECCIIDVGDKKILRRLRRNVFDGIVFVAKGTALATKGRSSTESASDLGRPSEVCTWSTATGKMLRVTRLHRRHLSGWASRGNQIVAGAMDGTACVYDAQTVVADHRFRGDKALVLSMLFDPSGEYLATIGAMDRTIRVWSMKHRSIIHEVPTKDSVLDIAFSSEGSSLAAGAGANISFWKFPDCESSGTIEVFDSDESARCIEFGPKDLTLLVGSTSGRLLVLDVGTREQVAGYGIHDDAITDICLSPDEHIVATASLDTTIRILDAKDFKEKLLLDGFQWQVQDIEFSPNGKLMAVAESELYAENTDHLALMNPKGRITVWETSSWLKINTFEVPGASRIGFSHDSERILCGSRQVLSHLRIYDSYTGKPVWTHDGGIGTFPCVAVSKDGRFMAGDTGVVLGDMANYVRVWETAPKDSQRISKEN